MHPTLCWCRVNSEVTGLSPDGLWHLWGLLIYTRRVGGRKGSAAWRFNHHWYSMWLIRAVWYTWYWAVTSSWSAASWLTISCTCCIGISISCVIPLQSRCRQWRSIWHYWFQEPSIPFGHPAATIHVHVIRFVLQCLHYHTEEVTFILMGTGLVLDLHYSANL